MKSPRIFRFLAALPACAIAVYIFLGFASISYSQVEVSDDGSGKEFLICFMQNELPNFDMTPVQPPTRYQDIYIASVSDPATVTITCKAFPGWSKVITIPAQGSAVYRLSDDPTIGFPNHDAIIESSEVIDSTVFRVNSTSDIVCVGMSNKQFTGDAFLALPREFGSKEYLEYHIMSYYNSTNPILLGDFQPSEFLVASFDDNDTVTIIPSSVTKTGVPANHSMTFVLNSGEAVQIQADINNTVGDLTGSIVRSTKPVVVYGGDSRTEVPTGFVTSQGTTSRDLISASIPPLAMWGTAYILENTGRPLGDLIRVQSSVNNTTIKINGQVWGAPFGSHEFRDTLIQFSDVKTDNIVAVEASQPILVGLLGHSAEITTQFGDPFLALMTSLDQIGNFSIFITPSDATNYDPANQFVTIVTEKSGVSKMSIDGIQIPASAFTAIPTQIQGKNYAIATLHETPGMHRVESDNDIDHGFTGMAFGFGNLTGYGYGFRSELKPAKSLIRTPLLTQASLENYPNPVQGSMTIRFAIPMQSFASIKLYDALGRVVTIIKEGMTNSGDQEIKVSTQGLIPGEYTVELFVPALGISLHRKLIVME